MQLLLTRALLKLNLKLCGIYFAESKHFIQHQFLSESVESVLQLILENY